MQTLRQDNEIAALGCAPSVTQGTADLLLVSDDSGVDTFVTVSRRDVSNKDKRASTMNHGLRQAATRTHRVVAGLEAPDAAVLHLQAPHDPARAAGLQVRLRLGIPVGADLRKWPQRISASDFQFVRELVQELCAETCGSLMRCDSMAGACNLL